MPKEKPEFELSRLRAELSRTRQEEVFGGLSPVNSQNIIESQSAFTNWQVKFTWSQSLRRVRGLRR